MSLEVGFDLTNPFETVGGRGFELAVPGYGDTMDSFNNSESNQYNQGDGTTGLPQALLDFLLQKMEPATPDYRNAALSRRLKVLG